MYDIEFFSTWYLFDKKCISLLFVFLCEFKPFHRDTMLIFCEAFQNHKIVIFLINFYFSNSYMNVQTVVKITYFAHISLQLIYQIQFACFRMCGLSGSEYNFETHFHRLFTRQSIILYQIL
jgi:hypothetical protein